MKTVRLWKSLSAQIQGSWLAIMQHGDQVLREYVKSYKPKKFTQMYTQSEVLPLIPDSRAES